mmetsp:Transcript_22871/g.45837  ORF Transcript_22871/g.45837 Transcript_22871/m.45837 type:complete len:217 (+) Transcript_22871:178-828(+)
MMARDGSASPPPPSSRATPLYLSLNRPQSTPHSPHPRSPSPRCAIVPTAHTCHTIGSPPSPAASGCKWCRYWVHGPLPRSPVVLTSLAPTRYRQCSPPCGRYSSAARPAAPSRAACSSFLPASPSSSRHPPTLPSRALPARHPRGPPTASSSRSRTTRHSSRPCTCCSHAPTTPRPPPALPSSVWGTGRSALPVSVSPMQPSTSSALLSRGTTPTR